MRAPRCARRAGAGQVGVGRHVGRHRSEQRLQVHARAAFQSGVDHRVEQHSLHVIARFVQRDRFDENGAIHRRLQRGAPLSQAARARVVGGRSEQRLSSLIVVHQLQIGRTETQIDVGLVDPRRLIVLQADAPRDVARRSRQQLHQALGPRSGSRVLHEARLLADQPVDPGLVDPERLRELGQGAPVRRRKTLLQIDLAARAVGGRDHPVQHALTARVFSGGAQLVVVHSAQLPAPLVIALFAQTEPVQLQGPDESGAGLHRGNFFLADRWRCRGQLERSADLLGGQPGIEAERAGDRFEALPSARDVAARHPRAPIPVSPDRFVLLVGRHPGHRVAQLGPVGSAGRVQRGAGLPFECLARAGKARLGGKLGSGPPEPLLRLRQQLHRRDFAQAAPQHASLMRRQGRVEPFSQLARARRILARQQRDRDQGDLTMGRTRIAFARGQPIARMVERLSHLRQRRFVQPGQARARGGDLAAADQRAQALPDRQAAVVDQPFGQRRATVAAGVGGGAELATRLARQLVAVSARLQRVAGQRRVAADLQVIAIPDLLAQLPLERRVVAARTQREQPVGTQTVGEIGSRIALEECAHRGGIVFAGARLQRNFPVLVVRLEQVPGDARRQRHQQIPIAVAGCLACLQQRFVGRNRRRSRRRFGRCLIAARRLRVSAARNTQRDRHRD